MASLVGNARVSTRFGKYSLVDRIAVGGMAEIFLARQAGLEGFEKTIVIKRIRPHLSNQKSFVKMFLNEAKLAAQLHHHNIVQVNDIGQEDGEYFFAMEYVHGEDVRKLLARCSERDQRVPLAHVLTIATAAAAKRYRMNSLPYRRLCGRSS